MSPQSVFQEFLKELERFILSAKKKIANLQNHADQTSSVQELTETTERFYQYHQSFGQYLQQTKDRLSLHDLQKLVTTHQKLHALTSAVKSDALMIQRAANGNNLSYFLEQLNSNLERITDIFNDINRPLAELPPSQTSIPIDLQPDIALKHFFQQSLTIIEQLELQAADLHTKRGSPEKCKKAATVLLLNIEKLSHLRTDMFNYAYHIHLTSKARPDELDMMSGLNCELITPISAIKGFTQLTLLQYGVSDSSPNKLEEYIAPIQKHITSIKSVLVHVQQHNQFPQIKR